MLAYIKGILEMKMTGYIVIDVGGLGYKVFMSESGIEKLGNIGEQVKVHTYYKVREDDISIFGFNTLEELKMFELLLRSKWNRSQNSNSNAFKYNSIKICISNNIK